MYCQNCGSKLSDTATTCENCGWKIAEPDFHSPKSKRTFSKKRVFFLVGLFVIALAIIMPIFGSKSSQRNDPSLVICGSWKSKKAGIDIETDKDLQNYTRSKVIFNKDGTGSIDVTGDGQPLEWTWKYCPDETKTLNDGSIAYELTFRGAENSPVYAIYKDESIMLTLPKLTDTEVTIYCTRSDSNSSTSTGISPSHKTSNSSSRKSTSSTVSQEYQNALNKGLQYANQLHMSKKGVYDQLTSSYGEGFPADAAQYAIDHMTSVDWNANALAKAKQYYNDMSMSKSAVYDQLTSEYGEQFTASEAQYAINHLN